MARPHPLLSRLRPSPERFAAAAALLVMLLSMRANGCVAG
jgi:hypothetical protein